MGYVPPHHNIVAVHYGNRMKVRQASIRRKEKVQKVKLPDLMEYKKEKEFESGHYNLYTSSRRMENQFLQKGLLFDQQA
ncbi:hypothetical protein [Alkalihalobacterium sp. APHAB7]|uniref:hypothetical protein n=1 Tax=Alkalihalobacterium sp. APHAB7 TaxID=3402081 RepID=UPI003AAC444E